MKYWKDKEEFKQRVRYYAEKLDITIKALYMRPMKTKWASCSTHGNLNFNSELLEYDTKIGEYVIVHELLHFNVPNHGKLWKSLMHAYLGDYEKIEKSLKNIGRNNGNIDPPFLASSRKAPASCFRSVPPRCKKAQGQGSIGGR